MRFLSLPGVSAGEGCFTSPMGSPNHLSIMRTSPYAFAEPFRPFPYESRSRSAVHSRKNPIGDRSHHQRCPSESVILEKPAWFDDLLSEPDNKQMPVKGHRRSSSDSAAYLSVLERKTRNTNKIKSKLDNCSFAEPQILVSDDEDMWKGSMKKNLSSPDNQSCEFGELSLTSDICSTSTDGSPRSASSLMITKTLQEEDIASPKHDFPSGKSCFSPSKQSVLKGEDKRTKQCRQSAHRSRIRKLQYIAKLERDIQVLQAEGSEFATALEFLDQQKFMLDMENRALRQQLETLAQEHMIQHLEQEMLEREVAKLRALYQIQMQQQPKRHQKKK